MENNTSYGIYSNISYTCVYEKSRPVEYAVFLLSEILLTVFGIPAIILNSWIIKQYARFHSAEKRKNSSFFIVAQAITNLLHVIVTCPLIAVAIRTYYVDNFRTTSKQSWIRICRGFSLTVSWLMLTSVLGRLQMFVFASLDRMFAVWKPLFWYKHLNSKYRKCRVIMMIIWLTSAAFGFADMFVLKRDFQSKIGTSTESECFHLLRAFLCLFLLVLMISIWGFTFYQSCTALRHSCRVNITSNASMKNEEHNDPDPEGKRKVLPLAPIPESVTPARLVRGRGKLSSSSLSVRVVREWKLVRTYSIMLLMFLIGYSPVFLYMCSYLIDSRGYYSSRTTAVRIFYTTRGTGLAFMAFWSPWFVLAQMKQFRRAALRKMVVEMFTVRCFGLDNVNTP